MNHTEQTAFLDAYDNTVADVSKEQAALILKNHLSNTFDNFNLPEGYTSVLDALGMWNQAVKFAHKTKVTQ